MSKLLDEETSAIVLAEYLVIGKVDESEIKFIEENGRGLSYRQIAITFRMAELLSISDAFQMAPRYRDAFAALRAVLGVPTAEAVRA